MVKKIFSKINKDTLINLKKKSGKKDLKKNSQQSTQKIIQNILENSAYETYYDDWIRNFSLNLNHIWKGHSAKELNPDKIKKESSALVIGRGPSINRNNHLELLANSNYQGTIMCCDGSLVGALKAGVTPQKFPNYFVITIDSQKRQKRFYKDKIIKKYGKKIKSILSTTVSPETYKEVKKNGMDVYWVHTLIDYNLGKSSFNYISGIMTKTKNHEKGLPAIQTGGNVGTAAWITSWSILKKKYVGLIGIDHGYYSEDRTIDDHFFPSDIDKNSNAFKKAYPIIFNPMFNCYCQQDPIFQYYSNALKKFIRKTSKTVYTINATEGGSIFGKGIICTTLENYLKKYNF